MSYTYHYTTAHPETGRLCVPASTECATYEEALRQAADDFLSGEAYPKRITDASGDVVATRTQVIQAAEAR